MIERQSHRGPDGHGMHVYQEDGVLGHTRLAIIDPAEGQQPIYNEDKSSIIVANGEVYNHALLRKRLAGPHRFKSASDSESVLHLFEEQRLSTAQQLDGMFAFAVARKDGLFLARDPIGIKPLYYGLANRGTPEEKFFFASELKAIADWADEIYEFPPGTYYHSKKGFRSYYSVPENMPADDIPAAVQIQQVRETLEQAVTKRLMSDVPLGAFLSGGLDSSIIAALTRQQKDELHTFSVGIEGSRDLEAARRVARHIDSIHHEYIYTAEEVLELLPEIIYYLESFDQDLVRSAIPTFFCARMAAEHVKVILTGEGADELFAGYTYYRRFETPDDLHGELHRSIRSLHNLNLQRVDRMTMRHSIEGRVPFLDTTLIDLAQTIPTELKLYQNGGGRKIEKWVLRKAVEDLLPSDIIWRNKEQFDEGSGTVDLLIDIIKQSATDIDPVAYAKRYPNDRLRSREECFYHKLLVDSFQRPERVLKNVGRWQVL
jgi:asparagine synthase (glutamine-hydrolysing)